MCKALRMLLADIKCYISISVALIIFINLPYYFCFQSVQPDKEIVVDMIMFLWQKCKLGIQKISMSRNDYVKFTQKISTNKVFLFVSSHLFVFADNKVLVCISN